MAVKERMDWYSFTERVFAGVVTGIVTGVVLYYTYPQVVMYLEAQRQEAYLRPVPLEEVTPRW